MFFKDIYNDYKETKKERDYYSRENFLKEERYRKLNQAYKELEKENKQLKEQLEQALKDYDALIQKPKRGRKKKND